MYILQSRWVYEFLLRAAPARFEQIAIRIVNQSEFAEWPFPLDNLHFRGTRPRLFIVVIHRRHRATMYRCFRFRQSISPMTANASGVDRLRLLPTEKL